MNRDVHYCDVFILGGGPSGVACALGLAESGLKVVLADKATFPRDKICGDALSPDVITQLKMITPTMAGRFSDMERKHPIKGVVLSSPGGHAATFDVLSNKIDAEDAYLVARMDFDHMLMQELKSRNSIEVLENTCVIDLVKEKDGVKVFSDKGAFFTKMYVGADGVQSISNKILSGFKMDHEHHCAAMRVYYKDVKYSEGPSKIELHFLGSILPGYLWIFPMKDGVSNVGIGMLSSSLRKKKVNLRKELDHFINTDERFKDRFKDATPMEQVRGMSIPVGGKKNPLSGDHFLLTGDAASLVDPLSGEGIANALRSGRFAAKYIMEAFEQSRFDATFLSRYDKKVYQMLMPEFRINQLIQWLLGSHRTADLLIRMASEKSIFRRVLVFAVNSLFFSRWNQLSYYFNAAWAAAKRAMGTRKGEQLT